MAKPQEETVAVPVGALHELQSRLAALEHAARIRQEQAENPEAVLLDPAYEAWKKEASRPAAERTQDAANRLFKGPNRYRVFLDSTTDEGKPGPNISEHPAVVIAAHSPEEAEARWLKLCGVRRHDYRLRAELVGAA